MSSACLWSKSLCGCPQQRSRCPPCRSKPPPRSQRTSLCQMRAGVRGMGPWVPHGACYDALCLCMALMLWQEGGRMGWCSIGASPWTARAARRRPTGAVQLPFVLHLSQLLARLGIAHDLRLLHAIILRSAADRLNRSNSNRVPTRHGGRAPHRPRREAPDSGPHDMGTACLLAQLFILQSLRHASIHARLSFCRHSCL